MIVVRVICLDSWCFGVESLRKVLVMVSGRRIWHFFLYLAGDLEEAAGDGANTCVMRSTDE